MKNIEKAYAISDAKIRFVSLVDKAANKKRFLITKAEGGSAAFQSFGRILKTDQDSHFVTGIVYEPMAEDTDGNYMTAAEIEKAAHWFMKHGGDVDIQHCFEKAEGVDVVESFVAKGDMEIEGQRIAKGTWLMTMEVSDDGVGAALAKGDITGFSMGGAGCFSSEDVDLGQVEKQAGVKGLLGKLAKSFGMELVEKGRVKDDYRQRVKCDNFWTAYSTLEAALRQEVYVPGIGCQYVYTGDEGKIREALEDFNEIIMELLASDDLAGELEKAAGKAAAQPGSRVEKAGRSLSSKNLATLQSIAASLSDFLSGFAETEDCGGSDAGVEKSGNKTIVKEDAKMTQEQVKALVEGAVSKAMEPVTAQLEELAKADGGAGDAGGAGTGQKQEKKGEKEKEKEDEEVAKMVSEAVAKAVEPVAAQIEAIRKSRALPSNLNDGPSGDALEKSGQHYLHGIL